MNILQKELIAIGAAVTAMLIAFIALVELVNVLLGYAGY